ncbi:MAG: hypothetical protein ACPGXK_12110 [Phycisphaerae bacterium]
MTHQHTPDPEFLNRLEWNVTSALRRQETFEMPTAKNPMTRYRVITTVALVLVSTFIGGAGTYAALRKIDKEAAALHIARAEAQLAIATTKLNPLVAEYATMKDRVSQGMAPEHGLKELQIAIQQATSNVDQRELELIETRLTGLEPNNNLSAPLVAGRDFVTERLNAQRETRRLRVEVSETEIRRLQGLMDDGLISESQLRSSKTALIIAAEELDQLQDRISLRASFASASLTAPEVELMDMRLTAQVSRSRALHQVTELTVQRERLTELVERGLASSSQLRDADAALLEASAEIEIADLELRILEQEIEAQRQE